MVKRYTRDADYSLSLGIAPTIELLQRQPQQVRELILSAKAATSEQVGNLLQLCRQLNIPTDFNDRNISVLGGQDNTYVIGVFNKYAEDIAVAANHLVLAQPSDAGNLGTIMRTMAAFGFRDLDIIEPAVDVWDPKVVRASMGAIFQMNIHMFPTFADFTAKVPNPMYMFTGAGEKSLNKLKLQAPYSLVFGSEGAGLPADYLQQGETVKIPQTDAVDSLNLAIAVGISLFALQK